MTNNDRDKLYLMFNQVEEERKRRNFNAFMNGFETGLINDLNKAYVSGDIEKYNKMVNNIKSKGIKIFRNSEGIHKLKFI